MVLARASNALLKLAKEHWEGCVGAAVSVLEARSSFFLTGEWRKEVRVSSLCLPHPETHSLWKHALSAERSERVRN